MEKDNQIKHHLYWILREMGKVQPQDYKEIMNGEIPAGACESIDELVAHIKLNY